MWQDVLLRLLLLRRLKPQLANGTYGKESSTHCMTLSESMSVGAMGHSTVNSITFWPSDPERCVATGILTIITFVWRPRGVGDNRNPHSHLLASGLQQTLLLTFFTKSSSTACLLQKGGRLQLFV
jgi:hypothetical protein